MMLSVKVDPVLRCQLTSGAITGIFVRPLDPNHLSKPTRSALGWVNVHHRLCDDDAGGPLAKKKMTEPLEYRTPIKRPSQASVILGVLSIACAPAFFLFMGTFHNFLEYDFWIGGLWVVVLSGVFLGVSGIAYSKSRPMLPWIGLILNLLVLAFFLYGRAGGFGWQDWIQRDCDYSRVR